MAFHVGDELHELEARLDPRLLQSLDMVAPGTPLREGIDSIIHARTGGLILITEPEDASFLFSGGIKLDIDYTPALLYQVAKMDGAIVLDPRASKIHWANVQLMPDPTILSMETGTRHRTAERVSKQTNALVIAISQRRDVVSLYVEGLKYILQEIPQVLSKANQGLATLEKYRSRLDQVSARLTGLELLGGCTLHDPAGRVGLTDGGRGRALHHRARHRGSPDRDAARGDRGRRHGRARGARPRLQRGRLRRAGRQHPAGARIGAAPGTARLRAACRAPRL